MAGAGGRFWGSECAAPFLLVKGVLMDPEESGLDSAEQPPSPQRTLGRGRAPQPPKGDPCHSAWHLEPGLLSWAVELHFSPFVKNQFVEAPSACSDTHGIEGNVGPALTRAPHTAAGRRGTSVTARFQDPKVSLRPAKPPLAGEHHSVFGGRPPLKFWESG